MPKNAKRSIAYNRLLIRPLGIEYMTGPRTFTHDYSTLLSFVLEEFIAASATELLVPWYYEKELAEVPKVLKKRVGTIGKVSWRRAWQEAHAITDPLFRDVGVQLGGTDLKLVLNDVDWRGWGLSYHYVFPLRNYVHDILLGIRYGLCVDLPFSHLQECATDLADIVHAKDARAALATISGVVGTYSKLRVNCPVFRSDAPADYVAAFSEVLHEETYRNMSKERKRMGVPEMLRHSRESLKHLVRKFLSNKRFEHMFALGTRAVSAATKLPMPDSAFAQAIVEEGFLPPVISLRQAYRRAYQTWLRCNPEMREWKGQPMDIPFGDNPKYFSRLWLWSFPTHSRRLMEKACPYRDRDGHR